VERTPGHLRSSQGLVIWVYHPSGLSAWAASAGTHLTPDQGGTATAVQFCDAVEAALRRPHNSA
jgi:hypothetical protein